MEERNGLAAVPEQPSPPSGGFSVRKLKEERYYDLSEAGVDARGHVPFPSHERRQRFFEELDAVFEEVRKAAKAAGKAETGEGDESFEDALLNRPNLFTEAFGEDREQYDRFVEITARLCNGSPTKAELKKLPPDVFMNGEDGFFDWLLGITAPKTMRASGTA